MLPLILFDSLLPPSLHQEALPSLQPCFIHPRRPCFPQDGVGNGKNGGKTRLRPFLLVWGTLDAAVFPSLTANTTAAAVVVFLYCCVVVFSCR